MNRISKLTKQGIDLTIAIDSIQAINKLPKRPQEPKLNTTTPTKEQMELYQTLSDNYPSLVEKYLKEKEEYRIENNKIQDEIKEAIFEDTGLGYIPKQYQEKIWSFAWNEKHSGGYNDVISFLNELVEIFD